MHTFEPARNSDPQPCVVNELRISGPYQWAIRCGTKKTKTSSDGAATIWVSTILLIDSKPMYHEESRTQFRRCAAPKLFHKFRRFDFSMSRRIARATSAARESRRREK